MWSRAVDSSAAMWQRRDMGRPDAVSRLRTPPLWRATQYWYRVSAQQSRGAVLLRTTRTFSRARRFRPIEPDCPASQSLCRDVELGRTMPAARIRFALNVVRTAPKCPGRPFASWRRKSDNHHGTLRLHLPLFTTIAFAQKAHHGPGSYSNIAHVLTWPYLPAPDLASRYPIGIRYGRSELELFRLCRFLPCRAAPPTARQRNGKSPPWRDTIRTSALDTGHSQPSATSTASARWTYTATVPSRASSATARGPILQRRPFDCHAVRSCVCRFELDNNSRAKLFSDRSARKTVRTGFPCLLKAPMLPRRRIACSSASKTVLPGTCLE